MRTKQIVEDEEIFGQVRFPRAEIQVNLERIWFVTKDWDSFVKLYADTVLHEHLHVLIDKFCSEVREDYEEEVVRKMTGEEEPDVPVKRLFEVWKV